jgi:serine/threonine-protein kinase RsbW
MKPLEFKMIFPAFELAARKSLANLLENLAPLGLGDEEKGTVELVMAEVFNNIVEHAYADTPGGIIEVAVASQDNGLHFTVVDSGAPMPDNQVPLGNRALLDCELENLPEGGFGWFLIRDLARDLDYCRDGGKNRLSFRISVGLVDLLA